ncbi:putative ribonuclease H-like domain-containing protein, partial [Tanacetum coccineum]
YSTNSKAYRVFNSRTRIVEENLHVKFSEETPNIAGNGPNWLFDIDTLTKSMNYETVVAGNQSNGIAGTKACENAGKARLETAPRKDYILLPFLTKDPPFSSSSKDSTDVGFKPSGEEKKKDAEDPENEDSVVPNTEEPRVNQEKDASVNSTNTINTVSPTVNAASIEDNAVDENIIYGYVDDPNMPNLEEIVYSDDDEDVDAEADMTNLDTHILVSPTPTIKIYKDHPLEQIIGDIHSAPQTRRMTKSVTDHVEPKKVIQALTDPSWIEAMQDELLQFKLQKGYTQEEGIDYDEVFALVARIEAIRLFLAYASFKNFVVYQMDVKSAFLYGKIEEEVYVCQPLKFEDPKFPDRVYKVEKALYGLHQAPRAWYETLSTYLLDNGFQRGQIDKILFIKRVKGDILLVQVYVDDIIFGFTNKSLCTEFEKLMHKKFQMSSMASTPMETSKSLMKDENAKDVDVYLYRLMIGSLMYLTSSRPDIIYLKGQPKLGLWYPKDSPFDLEAYTNSDYAGDTLECLISEALEWVGNAKDEIGCCQAKVNVARLLTTARLPLELQLLRMTTDHEETGDSMERARLLLLSIDHSRQCAVLALENVKTALDLEITSLKKRVKKLEKKKGTNKYYSRWDKSSSRTEERSANMALRHSLQIAEKCSGKGHMRLRILRTEPEKVNKKRRGFEFKIAKFENQQKLKIQPTTLDLSYSGLEEFKEPEYNKYGPRDSSLKPTTSCDKESDNFKENTDDSLEQHQMTDTKTSSFESPLKVDKDWKEKFFYPANHVESVNKIKKPVRKNNDAPIIEDWVLDDEDEVETTVVVKKKTVIPTAAKIEKPIRKPVRYAEMYRSQRSRGNQRN